MPEVVRVRKLLVWRALVKGVNAQKVKSKKETKDALALKIVLSANPLQYAA